MVMAKKSGVFSSLKNSWKNFKQTIPFFREEESLWDDGTDNKKTNLDDERGKFIYRIFTIYGVLSGLIACHYCKFMHQKVNCQLWNIPLTSKHVNCYSVIGFLSDCMIFAFVYAFALLLGVVLWAVIKTLYAKTFKNVEEYASAGMMYGLLALVITTIITAFIPFSIFLIGV